MAEAAEVAAYVARLLAILTNPNPTGIAADDPYGQADDGIDRSNGFGRDVWVESLQVVDGEHGAELEVTFGLAVPPDDMWGTVPDKGVGRVLLEREWRELSGYASPADYAPYVAREIEMAASSHVQSHRRGTISSTSRETTRRALPARQVQWQMLIDGLTVEGGPSVEVSPGRIDVRIADEDDHVDASSPVVTVIVTPDQWEAVLADHAWGNVEMYLAELLGPRDPDERFLVFYRGDLVRSIRAELPPVHGAARRPQAHRVPATRPGGWYAVAPHSSPDATPP